MLEVLAANELLEQAEALRIINRFDDLRDLLAPIPNRVIDADGGLGYYSALAAFRAGNHVKAVARIERALKALSAFDNTRIHRRCSNLMGIVLIEIGRLSDAEEWLLRASSLAADADDLEILANTTMNLGVVADVRCEWDRAVAAFTRARFAFERLAKHRLAAGAHHNLGMSLRQLGLLADSRTHFDHALDGFNSHGTEADLVATYSERALLLAILGDRTQAEWTAEYALSMARKIGHSRLVGECLRVLGVVLVRSGEMARARQQFELALPLSQDSHMLMLEAELHEELAILDRGRGDLISAEMQLGKCIGIYARIGAHVRGQRARDRYHRDGVRGIA